MLLYQKNIVKMACYPKQSTDLMQSLSNYPWHFPQNEQIILKRIRNYKRPIIAKTIWVHDLSLLLILSFKPAFSLSSFTCIKRLFSSSLFSAIRVVSSAYLRLSVFLPTVLISACASSSPAFCMTYSAYKLSKQDDNIQSYPTTFYFWTSCFMSSSVASWPTYMFLRRQVSWSSSSIHFF